MADRQQQPQHPHADVLHKKMQELDGVRRLLETRAAQVEEAAAAVEREKASLSAAYSGKVRAIADAKSRLEVQVRRGGSTAAAWLFIV